MIAHFPDAAAADVEEAVGAARAAGPAWRALTPAHRAEHLYALADRMAAVEQEIAELETVDTGNPITAMLDDVRAGIQEIRMFAGLATELKAASVANGDAQFAYGLREPYGVVGRITAFNHPVRFAAGRTAAAIISGNTMVLKPSERASLSTIRFAQLVHGTLPPGVVNVITGSGAGAGAAMASHPGVPRMAYIGGVEGGRAVLRAGAEHFKHVSVELGGKNPMIVFPDVHPAAAARAAVRGTNFARTQGQSCQSNSRVFVHDTIHDEFLAALVPAVEALKVGDPLVATNVMGPVCYAEHYDRVLGYIRSGIDEGAQLLTGGLESQGPGYYVQPTVFGSVEHEMTVAREEIFGPVLSVIRWSDYERVVHQANDTPFGLTANIWTDDLHLAHRTAQRVEAGYVWINGTGARVPGTPFGGYKASGLGKDSSIEEMLEFTRHKVVAVSI